MLTKSADALESAPYVEQADRSGTAKLYADESLTLQHVQLRRMCMGLLRQGCLCEFVQPEQYCQSLSASCRSNSRMPRCSSSRNGGGRTPGGSQDTDRYALLLAFMPCLIQLP